MEEKLKKLINCKIINKINLLLSVYKSIGITESELILLLKVANLDKDIYDVKELIELNSNASDEIEQAISSLISKKFIKYQISKRDNLILREVDFGSLWVKLLNTYFEETVDLNSDQQKIDWIINKFYFENNETITNYLENLLKKVEWNRILNLINDLETRHMTKISWTDFLNILEQNFSISNNYEHILNYDWLEN